MTQGMDIFGVVTGVLGLLGIVHSWLKRQLPRHRLKQVDYALRTVETLLHEALEEDLFGDGEYVSSITIRLFRYRCQAADFKSFVLCEHTGLTEYKALASGVTRRMSGLVDEVFSLRAELLFAMQEERHRSSSVIYLPANVDDINFPSPPVVSHVREPRDAIWLDGPCCGEPSPSTFCPGKFDDVVSHYAPTCCCPAVAGPPPWEA